MVESKRRPARRRGPSQGTLSCPNWSVEVENFGRISRGAVTMAPLVLLVGKNNTGKSYMASLLWALLNFDSVSFPRRDMATSVPKFVSEAVFDTGETGAEHKIKFGKSEYEQMSDYICGIFLKDNAKVIADLFALPSFDPPRMKIRFGNKGCHDYIFATSDEDAKDRPVSIHYTTNTREFIHTTKIRRNKKIGDLSWLPAALCDLIAANLLKGYPAIRTGETLYIPAARTGLMLAFPALVSGLLSSLRLRDDGKPKFNFPVPTIQFLQTFTDKSSEQVSDKIKAIVGDLERRVLGGSVVVSNDEIPTIMYHPEGGKVLPLHATSSMVTEIAPFLLQLRSGKASSGLIFEEPEAHLHISAQRVMAVAISKLVNSGVPVVLTTHSDTFVQQINNLIKLHESDLNDEELAGFGYERNDLINPELAKAYEFKEGADGTEVIELERTINGFIVPSLNEPLMDLAQETMEVQSDN